MRRELSRSKHIVETPDLCDGSKEQALRTGIKSHARTKLRWNTDSLPFGSGPISISCPV